MTGDEIGVRAHDAQNIMASVGSNTSSDDYEIIDHQEASLGPEALAQAQTWLQPTDYTAESSEFHRHLSSQAPGTGLWICDTPRFRQWCDSGEHGSLWIKGVPGAGKSVIAASMVEYLKTVDDVPVLLFFFRHIIAANRYPRSLVRDWLAQLLPHSIRLQASLQPLLGTELDDVSDEQLWEQLLTGLSSVEKAYCIVDALDEMELVAGDGFLGRLNSLVRFRPGAVKLLMTSRPKQYLQSNLRDASIVHISLEHDLVGKDITIFVSHRLKTVLRDDDQVELRESLTSTICAKSRGLFLYARLLLDQITPTIQLTHHLDIEKLVNSLPIGLEEMYNSMLSQQAESMNIDACVQVFVLECVTHSSRPLRLNELASVLARAFTPDKIPGNPKAIVRSACAPLLEILEDETVQVIHHSFTEFLLDIHRVKTPGHRTKEQFPVLQTDKVHMKLATTCLDYLRSGSLKSNKQPVGDESDTVMTSTFCHRCTKSGCDCEPANDTSYNYQDARLHYPFLEYAVENWAYHAGHYDIGNDGFFRSVTNFVDSENLDFRRWISLKWNTTRGTLVSSQTPSALHISAYAGLSEYAITLLHEGQSVHSLDAEDRTPLHWACKQNHAKMVSLLLANGANPDPEDCRGVKPIHEAARKNYAAIVKILLEAGVDPLSPKTRENHKGWLIGPEITTKGETAIQYICQQGHTEALLVILPFLRPETLEEVLCESCRYGKVENVRAVLENSKVSHNAMFTGATALYLACRAHSVQCVEMLLARGADVHLMSTWKPIQMGSHRAGEGGGLKETPMHALVRFWAARHHVACKAILRMLTRAGADLEAKDGHNETPLHSHTPPNSHLDSSTLQTTVKSLLEAGADVSAVDRRGDTLLHRLLQHQRNLEFLQLFLDHGACVNTRGRHGNTALHAILSTGYLKRGPNSVDEIVEFLLEKGADCNLKNDSGHTVLEFAVGQADCSLQTFKLLLKSCSDKNTLRRCLFQVGARHDYREKVKIIQELISAGLSLEARNETGQTALLANYRYEDAIKALLECGARLDAIDSNGWGLLDYFVFYSPKSHPFDERFQALVESGLDPLKVDKKGNSILHHAVKFYRGRSEDKFMQRILDYGVSVNAKNAAGCTPLHVHIEYSYILRPEGESPLISLLALFQRSSGNEFNVNAQDAEGMTPLHLAVICSEVDAARLLAAGADVNMLTNNGRNVLHLACRARQSNIVAFLLHKTGSTLIDKADSFGRMPLHDACTSGRPESVYYLLKAGANITFKDSNGRTPLHACAEFATEKNIWSLLERHNEAAGQFKVDRHRPCSFRRQLDCFGYKSPLNNPHNPTFIEDDTTRIGGIVKSLLAAGADFTITDSSISKRTPLNLALAYGCQEMVEILWSATNEKHPSYRSDPHNARMETLVALNRKVPIDSRQLSDVAIQELLRYPSRYLLMLDHEDINWIANNKVDIPNANSDYSGYDLLESAAQRGLTEIVTRIGTSAKIFDNIDAVREHIQKSGRNGGYTPPLHAACQRKLPNLEILEVLVDKCGVDVNARELVSTDPHLKSKDLLDGPTALHYLAEAKFWWQLDGIKLLVEKGANINSRNEKGETPLHIASVGNLVGRIEEDCGKDLGFWKPSCVQLLLDLGADPNALDNAGMSPFQKASSAPEIMRILLQRGADLSVGKMPPLFSAIHACDAETLKIILDMGASPNTKDITKACPVNHRVTDQERSALLCSCFLSYSSSGKRSSVPLVKLLIEEGADVYAPLNDRETLIHYVFEHAEYPIINAFLECSDKIDFNVRDQLGRTVLLAAGDWTQALPDYTHWAREPKVDGPVMRLLDCGADITAIDSEGRSALHHLLNNGEIEQDTILQFLERKPCQILSFQRDTKGFLPLHYALRTLRPPVCDVLVALGADLREPDPDGATALHHIAAQVLRVHQPEALLGNLSQEHPANYFEGCLRLWQQYLSLNGDINVRDAQGSPPLFAYLSSPQKDLSNKQLMEKHKFCHIDNFETFFGGKEVDVFSRNARGETALHIVARREKIYYRKGSEMTSELMVAQGEHERTLFEFMVAKGLDPLVEDGKGASALDVAAACGKGEILELFRYGR